VLSAPGRPLASVVLLVVVTAGCLGGLGGPPTVAVENDAAEPYAASVAVVETAAPAGDLTVALTYANGTTRRTSYATHAVGRNGSFRPPDGVVDVRVGVGARTSARWNVTLRPGERVERPTDSWEGDDLLVVTWTRLDPFRVAVVLPTRCDGRPLDHASAVVGPDGFGGSTGCAAGPL
jgi:hypothetical protein